MIGLLDGAMPLRNSVSSDNGAQATGIDLERPDTRSSGWGLFSEELAEPNELAGWDRIEDRRETLAGEIRHPITLRDVPAEAGMAINQLAANQRTEQERILKELAFENDRSREQLLQDVLAAVQGQGPRMAAAVQTPPMLSRPTPGSQTACKTINVRGLEKLDKLVEDISPQDFMM